MPDDIALWEQRTQAGAEELARLLRGCGETLPQPEHDAAFGAFVELAEGIEGLIHVSEFDESQHAGKDEKLDLKVGDSYQMKIIKLIPAERKVGLSIRALQSDEFRADWEAYTEMTGRPEVTLGDHFKHQN